MSLLEATIVVIAVSVLTAAAAPAVSRALDRMRIVRAISDAEAIKTAMVNWQVDMPGFKQFKVDGSAGPAGTPIDMAVSDGDTPVEVGPDGDDRWTHPVSGPTPPPGFLIVDFMENHFVLNNPFGGSSADAYSTGGGNAWRGAYMRAPIDPDPWGNRYAMNPRYLRAPFDTRFDTFVLSAGPDEQIDTAFERNGIVPGDDDIVVVINRDLDLQLP
ncbi:MAG TPA: hypothetical protein VNI78_11980 [Vicinamibacterales bacterium]|nr:hypothetical protein [Vicinamibacterales bacterium]